jgi:hypothetical protein
MGKNKRRYVAKAEPKAGWRVWDNKANRWWGQHYNRYPENLLEELNGNKSPEDIITKTRELQIEKRPQKPPKVVK